MTDVLKKEQAKADNRDPRGIQWGIFPQKGRALYLVRATKKNDEGKVVEDQKYAVPTECEGEWTHQDRAQASIERYLDRAWKVADEAIAKQRKPIVIVDEAVNATN